MPSSRRFLALPSRGARGRVVAAVLAIVLCGGVVASSGCGVIERLGTEWADDATEPGGDVGPASGESTPGGSSAGAPSTGSVSPGGAATGTAVPTPGPTPRPTPEPTTPASDAQAQIDSGTSCLRSRVVNVEFERPGSGDMAIDGVWVPFQVRVTNDCVKDVKAFEFDTEFRDAFGDLILSCGGKVSVSVAIGASRNTAKDTGCTVFSDDPAYQSWSTVRRADVVTSVEITRIVFADGSVVSSIGV